MSPFRIASLQQYVATLQPRDRRALMVLAAFMVFLCLWMGVYRPIETALAVQAANYRAAHADNAWIHAHAEQAKQSIPDKLSPMLDDSTLLAAVSAAAEAQQLTIARAEPAGNHGLRVTLDHAAFSHLLPWLDAMQREHGIVPVDVDIQRLAPSPGYVSAVLTLRQS